MTKYHNNKIPKYQINAKSLYAIIVGFVLLTDFFLLFDTSPIKIIFGLLMLLFLPGLLLLRILRFNELKFWETVILSIGLSVFSIMFFGLLYNFFLLSLNYPTPLSFISLFTFINLAFFTLITVGYLSDKDSVYNWPELNLNKDELNSLIFALSLPLISILGMYYMNNTKNNSLLLLLLFLIPGYICFLVVKQNSVNRIYAPSLFLIALSLLLFYLIRFPHIFGRDAHTEYYFFKETLSNLHWAMFENNSLNACLSITLFPAVISSLLGSTNHEFLFRILYIIICSFIPVAIFLISERYIRESYALLASFFFLAQSTFLSVLINPRTNLASFFVILVVLVMFSKNMSLIQKNLLLIIFLISCTVSHYATTYIFFIILLSTIVFNTLLSRNQSQKSVSSYTIIILFFVIIFFWNSQLTSVSFNNATDFVYGTLNNLNKLFIEETKDPLIKSLYAPEFKYSFLSVINFFIIWSSFVFVGLGVFTVLIKRSDMLLKYDEKSKSIFLLDNRIELENLCIALSCCCLLLAMIILPKLSIGYQIQRLYSFAVIILSTYFILGAKVVCYAFTYLSHKVKLFHNIKNNSVANVLNTDFLTHLVILVVVIPYFLQYTGAEYSLFSLPSHVTIDSNNEQYQKEYVHDQDSSASKWLMVNSDKNTRIYSDFFGEYKLRSQGEFYLKRTNSNSIFENSSFSGYVYLTYFNSVNMSVYQYQAQKLMVIDSKLSNDSRFILNRSKIYDNGCWIYS